MIYLNLRDILSSCFVVTCAEIDQALNRRELVQASVYGFPEIKGNSRRRAKLEFGSLSGVAEGIGPDAAAPASLDRVVERQHQGAARDEGLDEQPEQDAGFGAGRLCGAAEHPAHVHEMLVACPARDPQHPRHRTPAWTEDRTDQQGLSVPPRLVDEQRRERKNDPGEAGGQVRHEASLARDTISLSIAPASSPNASTAG